MPGKMIERLALVVALAGFTMTTAPAAADAPRVVEMFPENGATDVDPSVRELRVTFDRDMTIGRNYSYCGGGPTFPKIIGQPTWDDKRTIVAKVKLEPDHDYSLALNCPPDGEGFRSADGILLERLPWSFSTAAQAKKLSRAEQKKLNARCLKQLMKLLRDWYSYYDLRDLGWKGLQKKHRKKIQAAKSTRSWVTRVAKMLSDAEDLHLWLTYRGKTTATYQRKIKPNFNLDGVKAVLPSLKQRNNCVYTVRTDDNIGYILIGTLSHERTKELEQVPDFLEEYQDCQALIIDLRPNGGGAEPLAMPIAAWFVKGEKVYAKHVYRQPRTKGGFGPVNNRKIRGNDEPKRFHKPVAVLMGPGIMSSCEAFLLMMKQGEDVTLIGAPSYGSSGNPKPHLLDNGVEVFIPSWKALRPDGTCFEGQGLKPDIEVPAKSSSFKKRDPVLERALKHLRNKTG
jgi:hypothetical protein